MELTHNLISLFIGLDFLVLTISFFVLMTKLLPKVWLDEIAKMTTAVLLSASIIKFFA
jgi:hypothetical protein